MSKPEFETYPDNAGEYRWRLTAANGEIVGASSEGFSTEIGATKNAWRTLSGLTGALGVSPGNGAPAPDWLLEAFGAIKDTHPPLWGEICATGLAVGRYLLGRPDLPSYARAIVNKALVKFAVKPE